MAENKVVTKEEAIQSDIEKMNALIMDMKENGEELFAEEIKNLQQKIKNAEDELSGKVTKVVDDAQNEVEGWWSKHKNDIFNYCEIVVLVYIAYRLIA